ncbi:MAG: hypothetical protein J5I90_19425 [Caldilineales bacterium]|nr:hypothetical protein [Caldilineales bacterium]
MSTDQDPKVEPQSAQNNQAREAGSDIVRELGILGHKLGVAIRSALDSPQRYEIENEVREGFQTAVTEINDVIGKARSTDVAREMGEQTDKVVGAVRTSQVTKDLRDGFVKGLRTLNAELDAVVVRLEQQSEKEAAEADTTEVESEPVS